MNSQVADSFAEFCRAEIATGGPDPQLAMMAHLASPTGNSIDDKIWIAGCYGAHHCVPSAWIVASQFGYQDVLDRPDLLTEFLADNWDSLPVRPEMRSHRMLEKRSKCLRDFAQFAHDASESDIHDWTYDQTWANSIGDVKYYGRYMAIKFCELLRRMDIIKGGVYDMRAKHAWSPRKTLAMIFTEVADVVGNRDDNSPMTVMLAESCATETLNLLAARGVTADYFQLQVLLCEYKEALAAGYYPGASLDEEMEYIDRVTGFDKEMGDIWLARKALFPQQYLGEENGYRGLRKEKFLAWKR